MNTKAEQLLVHYKSNPYFLDECETQSISSSTYGEVVTYIFYDQSTIYTELVRGQLEAWAGAVVYNGEDS